MFCPFVFDWENIGVFQFDIFSHAFWYRQLNRMSRVSLDLEFFEKICGASSEQPALIPVCKIYQMTSSWSKLGHGNCSIKDPPLKHFQYAFAVHLYIFLKKNL